MSRVDELLEELCPDGVPYSKVSDLADYIRGVTYNKNDEDKHGPVGVLRANNITLSSNTLNWRDVKRVSGNVRIRDNQRLRKGDVLICAGSGSRDHIGKVAYISNDMDETFGGFMGVVRSRGNVEPRFLFHVLTGGAFAQYLASALSTTTINNLNSRVMGSFRIPVPPMEVQQEIVRILDEFTQLEAELEAELEARRAQYVYYRNELLTFEEGGVRWIPMGDFGEIFGGLTGKSKKDFVEGNARFAAYKNVFNNIALDIEADDYVKVSEGERQRVLQRGDILFTGSSEVQNEVAMASVVTETPQEPLYLNSFCIGFRQNDPQELRPDFAKHLFRAHVLREQLTKTANGVTRFNVSKARLAKVVVPIPSVERQDEVASLLDGFEAFVNDLSIGLPAELNARRKQYEYYRDKLLTFDELVA